MPKYDKNRGEEHEKGGTEGANRTAPGAGHSPHSTEQDTRKFVRAGTAEDPFTAEDYVRVLEAERIPVFSRPRRTGTVDVITTGATSPWWEIMVPEEHVQRAASIITQEKSRLDSTADEAVRAAEEEERETEKGAGEAEKGLGEAEKGGGKTPKGG